MERLYASSGICSFCKGDQCPHQGNKELPDYLKTDEVLEAINLDEYFFKEQG